MVTVSPGGPFPKNSGWLLVTVSPSVRLSKTTLFGAEDGAGDPTLILDSRLAVEGRLRLAFGIPVLELGV